MVLVNTILAQVTLTNDNRRSQIYGLPNWSRAGYLEGRSELPDDSKVRYRITAEELMSRFQVIPNDGVDDTHGLQGAIDHIKSIHIGGDSNFALIELPSGTINLSSQIYLDASFLIIRGKGNDPNSPGSTKIILTPDENTRYDTLTSDGSRWDLENMKFEHRNKRSTVKATGGWIWPGRGAFRVQKRDVAFKFEAAHLAAPANRKDLFEGSVNFHWKTDGSGNGPRQNAIYRGFLVDQTLQKAGFKGGRTIQLNIDVDITEYQPGRYLWLGVPASKNNYVQWGVTTTAYYQNQYMFQDVFKIVGVDKFSVTVDRDLEFDVYTSSIADGSEAMDDSVSFTKALPLSMVESVGLENFYLSQALPGQDASSATHNYGNLSPADAMHGIVFKWAANSWVRNVRTFMTGSHPIVTEVAKNIQIQNNFLEGAWNKGKGGNGYLRGSRVWDSIYSNNTLRNLRHFTFQWTASRNVAILNDMDCDFNLHGGWEGYNLIELNKIVVPAGHAPGRCTANCGGEGGDTEEGAWYPIWWGAGEKASKWSGATGPQNIYFHNIMTKQLAEGGSYKDYEPYYRTTSFPDNIFQMGWDRLSTHGIRYQHLTSNADTLLVNWTNSETLDYSKDPLKGVNALSTDDHKSLFLKTVPNIDVGRDFCDQGKFSVGYYLTWAPIGECYKYPVEAIKASMWTHLHTGYAVVKTDGSVQLPDENALSVILKLQQLKTQNPNLKVILSVGGWAYYEDSANFIKVVHSAAAQKTFLSSVVAMMHKHKFDGLDVEYASQTNTDKFITFLQSIRTSFNSQSGVNWTLSAATTASFWRTIPSQAGLLPDNGM
ncbi:hypothetical protein K7432_011984 [Basidiobolus ranarum]|uniref:GH18 domain-containing protein n=1 Tax=Basidiobolus ranarum TaxID=34480 RepID=A0ABR2VSZ7_9FUNG